METVKKNWILGIFISILMIFAMSYNTFATDVVPGNAQLTGWNASPQLSCWRYYNSNDTSWTGWDAACYIAPGASNVSVKAVALRGSNGGQIWANPGDILQIQIAMVADLTENQPQIYYLPSDSATLQVISMKVDGSFTAKEGKQLILTYYAKYIGSTPNPSAVFLGLNAPTGRDMFAYGSMSYYLTGYSVSAWSSSLENNDDIVSAIEDMAEQEQQHNEDIRNELEQGQEDLNDAGESSQNDAESATSNLISVIGSFVGAVTSASPSNCRIDGNMGHMNLGNLDLCANPVPAFIQVIGSLLLILILVPLAIVLFNRFINLFRSFQN